MPSVPDPTGFLGHSRGRATLFFAERWERFSDYGMRVVTKLAHREVGRRMGVWLMSISLGNLLAGLVAGRFEVLPLPQLFGAVFAITAGAGLLLALLAKPVRKLMSGVE